MNKLRIGNFLFHYPQPGGTSGTLAGLSGALASLGHEVSIYCCGDPGPDSICTHPDVELLHHSALSRNPFRLPPALTERLKRNAEKLDLLLVHGFFNPTNIVVARAARRGNIPYIACPSGLYHSELMRKNRILKILYGTLFEKPYLRKSTAIQVFGELQARLIHEYAETHPPIVTVPNGFDPAEVVLQSDACVHEAAVWDGPGPHWLFFGRVDMHTKGLDLLFEAIGAGITRGLLPATLHLKLVGPDWGDKARLELLAKQIGIVQNITFSGRVDERTKWQVLASCDMVVLTSRHDAYPRAVVEAMVSGKPVLISTQTSLSELIRKQEIGYTVDPTVDSILAGLVLAIQSRGQWHSMGIRAKLLAYEQLLWSQVASRAAEIYGRLIRPDWLIRAESSCSQPS